MNCTDKGYKVGQVFEVIKEDSDELVFSKGSLVRLTKDDGSSCPKFDLISEYCEYENGLHTKYGAYENLDYVKLLSEEEATKALNLI